MSAKVLYTWVYPTHTVHGDQLILIDGTQIQLKHPGDREYKDYAFVPFPIDELIVEIKKSGAYGIRHIITGPHSKSEPSDQTAISIDCRVPSQPSKGLVEGICLQS